MMWHVSNEKETLQPRCLEKYKNAIVSLRSVRHHWLLQPRKRAWWCAVRARNAVTNAAQMNRGSTFRSNVKPSNMAFCNFQKAKSRDYWYIFFVKPACGVTRLCSWNMEGRSWWKRMQDRADARQSTYWNGQQYCFRFVVTIYRFSSPDQSM